MRIGHRRFELRAFACRAVGLGASDAEVVRAGPGPRPYRLRRSALSALGVTMVMAMGGCYQHSRRPSALNIPPEAVTEMISIPEGRFTQGDLNGEPAEYPERKVVVSGFSIDRYEVSNAVYRLCVAAGVCDPTPYLEHPTLGRDTYPVVGLSWEDAHRICRWLGRRLPTEAEWEYAARGGDERRFPWDGPFDPNKANTDRTDAFPATAPVDEIVAGDSPFGVRNMAGNAAEWVNDFFDPMYYQMSDVDMDPPGPPRGRERVVRGGSYRDSPYLVRVAARRAQAPTDIDNTVGVRCAR